jgi:hypothetical protein
VFAQHGLNALGIERGGQQPGAGVYVDGALIVDAFGFQPDQCQVSTEDRIG